MQCPACGTTAPSDARFCPSCGQSLVARPDERRVATVLFADLVGFTGYSEAEDPERVKNLVDHCFAAVSADVQAYGGQVDKIVGDALVALFGAPVAHEDDAERAVRAALQMQHTLDRLHVELDFPIQIRIGINTGEVLVGALRAGGDYTAMGDVVNIASRLQTGARPGQVVVGPTTYSATQHCVEYEALGLLTVRGRDEPVEAWAATGVLAPPGKRRRRTRTRLVGRDAEVALVRAVLDAAVARRRAHLVIVGGDAGVGKSRLVGEVAECAAERHDALVLTGQCVPYGEDLWWPIAEVVRAACDVPLEASHDDARARVQDAVAGALGRSGDDAVVTRTVTGLLYLLGFEVELHDLDPSRARDDALRSVQTLLSGLAGRRPLVVVLSDLHWADDLVLTLVDRLVDYLRALPFVLLATARPELDERWRPAPGRHNALNVALEPLDAAAVEVLVSELLGDDTDDEVVALLRERSGGNPFFVEELAALLRETGSAGPEVTARTRLPGRLPATLQGLVAARLDALGPAERNVLEDCAIVGASGALDAVRELATRRQDALDPDVALDLLAERDLIELGDDEYAFSSEVIRDVAYATLTKAERARRHAALGDWLAARAPAEDGGTVVERVAHHYGTAARLLRELGPVDGVAPDVTTRALAVLEMAAERARDAEIWRSASRLYDDALAVLPPDAADTTRWRLQLGRARALAEQRELVPARTDVEDVLDDSSDERVTARALILLGDLQQMEGDYQASIATLDRAIEVWRRLDDAAGEADALRARGGTVMFQGDLDSAELDMTEALGLFRRVGDHRGEAWAVQNLATIAFFRGDPDLADARLTEAAEMFRLLDDWGGLNWTFAVLAWVRFMQGRLEDAEALAREQLPESEATGNRWVSGILDMLLGSVNLWSGRAGTAVEYARKAVAQFHALGDPWGENQARTILVRALAIAGRVDEALTTVDTALDGPRGTPEGRKISSLVRAQVLVHTGSPDALAGALHATRPDERWTLSHEYRMVLAMALVQAGRIDEAIAELEDARVEVAENAGPGSANNAALAVAYVVAGRTADARKAADAGIGRGTYLDQHLCAIAGALARVQAREPDALEAFDDAIARIDATEARLDQAGVRVARAHALAALGHPDAAAARRDADVRLAALELQMPGWERAFARAVEPAPEPV
jgi:class 3 adenylate cyclase/tetratricopeptide (TPR) repeat protein